MLPKNDRREGLSQAYIRAVAAHAGLICTAPGKDVGIDLCLQTVVRRGTRYAPGAVQIDVQAKSTTRANLTEDHLAYDLDVKNFDDLRSATMCPRLLVVLVLPADEAEWLRQTEQELTIRSCAHWMWLGGAEAVATKRTTRLAIPRTNVFSAEGLRDLVARLERGENPC